MNTVSLYVSRMCICAAVMCTFLTLGFLTQFAVGASIFSVLLTTLFIALAVGFHMAYNRFRAELRQMRDEEEPNDYHLYPFEEVGDGSGHTVQVYSRGDVGGHPS